MDTLWKNALWQQFGATIDMLDNALAACPDSLWKGRLWNNQGSHFWYISYHTLFWLDLYLSASSEEDFAPPAPFTLSELDPAGALPERAYTKEELRAYLTSLREKCHDTLVSLTDEQARRPIKYPWRGRKAVSFLELQLYNLRHVHEHAAQLSLFLGQNGVPDEALNWVAFAKDTSE
jgi:uncharacterized damage-inducible protein DinB